MRVLAIEPYYGGSHRAFLDGWMARSRHDWSLLTLPANKWKWRMRHAAMTFADELGDATPGRWDALFCSDMLSLAELVGFLPQLLGPLPKVVYFHENQLTYPVQVEREWDLHFGLTNITTALAASALWFNSGFHRDEFLGAVPAMLKKIPHPTPEVASRLAAKSVVLPPGSDWSPRSMRRTDGPLRIVWAARWEFDKNPDLLFAALERLMERSVDFRISVLGERFERSPAVFERARVELGDRVVRWGFLPRPEYFDELARADVFVSTADHEFFGLSAVEAMAMGAYPLLPERLAYPELLSRCAEPGRHLYDGSPGELASRLEQLAHHLESRAERSLRDDDLTALSASMERFSWPAVAPRLDAELERASTAREAEDPSQERLESDTLPG